MYLLTILTVTYTYLKYEVSRKFWFEWSKCTTSAGQNQDLCYGIRKEKAKKKDEI